MNNEPLNAENAGFNYHSPKLISLGSIQSLVQSQALPPHTDGGTFPDGTAS
jgi:hypothetical protein